MLLTALNAFVTPSVPGAPTVIVQQAILDSAKEFLTETQVWNEVQPPVPLAANVQTYDMDAPIGARCIGIKEIFAPYLAKGRLSGVSLDELARMMPNWQTAQSNSTVPGQVSGAPWLYTRAFDFTTFNLYPMPAAPLPSANAYLQVHGVYTLLDTATTIPDDIYERYREVIVAGAKSRLLWMLGQSWGNEKLAMKADADVKNAKFRARVNAMHDKTNGIAVVSPRMFGRW